MINIIYAIYLFCLLLNAHCIYNILFLQLYNIIFGGFYVPQETYNNPDIYITENGFSQIGPVQLEDVDRCQFYQDVLQQVSKGLALAVNFMLYSFMIYIYCFICSNK